MGRASEGVGDVGSRPFMQVWPCAYVVIRMRRRILFVAALIALAAVPAASARGSSCVSPRSWVGGSAWLCKGMLVYGDYIDDDFGADTGAFDSTSRTAGLAPS